MVDRTLTERVQQKYAQAARTASCCDSTACCDPVTSNLYDAADDAQQTKGGDGDDGDLDVDQIDFGKLNDDEEALVSKIANQLDDVAERIKADIDVIQQELNK